MLTSMNAMERDVASDFSTLKSDLKAWQQNTVDTCESGSNIVLKVFAIMKEVYLAFCGWKAEMEAQERILRVSEFAFSVLPRLVEFESTYRPASAFSDSNVGADTANNNVEGERDTSALGAQLVMQKYPPALSEVTAAGGSSACDDATDNAIHMTKDAATSGELQLPLSTQLRMWLFATSEKKSSTTKSASLSGTVRQHKHGGVQKAVHYKSNSLKVEALGQSRGESSVSRSHGGTRVVGIRGPQLLSGTDLMAASQPIRIDPWLANRRWTIPGSLGGAYVPVEVRLPGSIIANSLMTEDYRRALDFDTEKAIEHAVRLRLDTTSDGKLIDDVCMILGSCVADEMQKTYHIVSR